MIDVGWLMSYHHEHRESERESVYRHVFTDIGASAGVVNDRSIQRHITFRLWARSNTPNTLFYQFYLYRFYTLLWSPQDKAPLPINKLVQVQRPIRPIRPIPRCPPHQQISPLTTNPEKRIGTILTSFKVLRTTITGVIKCPCCYQPYISTKLYLRELNHSPKMLRIQLCITIWFVMYCIC